MRLLMFAFCMISTPLIAGPPVIEDVQIKHSGTQTRFDVTLRHADTGWDHYADGWGVYDMQGTELGYRILHHPHVTEQPFTRSLTLALPDGVQKVQIIPRDSVHGNGEPFIISVP